MTPEDNETRTMLETRLAQYQTLLETTTRRRQEAIAQGNREIAGKLHQAEREWQRRIQDVRQQLARYEPPAATA